MLDSNLLRLAEEEVAKALGQLPPDVAEAAGECVVIYGDEADLDQRSGDHGEIEVDEDEGLLGLFEGFSRMDPLPGDPSEMPRISLFLETIWRMTGEDESEYCTEVRTTYLHELGHYLGWGEKEIAALGLG